jgi:hypothetical protein
LAQFAPGLDQAPRIETGSSSARVLRDGQPLGSGRGHIWVKTTPHDYDELVRGRNNLRDQLIVGGKCWVHRDKKGRPQVYVPNDFATWRTSGMIYSGKPHGAMRTGRSEVEARR